MGMSDMDAMTTMAPGMDMAPAPPRRGQAAAATTAVPWWEAATTVEPGMDGSFEEFEEIEEKSRIRVIRGRKSWYPWIPDNRNMYRSWAAITGHAIYETEPVKHN